jgi:hypothetical protein
MRPHHRAASAHRTRESRTVLDCLAQRRPRACPGSPRAPAADGEPGRLYILRFEALDGLAAAAAAERRDRIAASLTALPKAAKIERHDPIFARRLREPASIPRAPAYAEWRAVLARGARRRRNT